jgi:hypothetical protein
MIGDDRPDDRGVDDITVYNGHPCTVNTIEILEIAGIRQCIQHNHIVLRGSKHTTYKIASDESGTARDKDR